MPTWLPQDLLQRLQNLSEEVVNRALDRSVRLAVTGLSRSGKTVFITSLVHQLLLGLHGAKLPLVCPAWAKTCDLRGGHRRE
jgi:predicted YcjX-like family ATPase